MVERVLQGVYREVRGLHQAAYILALFTFGSQILALIRDRLLAHTFGAGETLDLYYTAFRIPDFLYVLFVSVLSIYVLIPFITKRTEGEGVESARELMSQVLSFFILCYTVIAVVAFVWAPILVEYFFPGFVSVADTLVLLMRILLVQPLLLGISSLLGIITQLEHRFIIFAISPLVYNLGIIAGVLFAYPYLGIQGLAVGVVIGALGHLIVQIPIVRKSPIRPRLTLCFRVGMLREVFRVSTIRALTLSLHQCVLLGFIGFASIMAVGSISVFQFAYNLQSVPLAIIGVSYSVAAFPLLAQLFAQKEYQQLGEQITVALRHVLFWSLPAIALFVVVRAQFIRVVLGSGAFNWDDTRLTAAVFALFMLSLTAQAMHLLLVRALYAVQNTRLPFIVTLISSSLALTFAFVTYVLLLTHGDFYNTLARLMRLEGVSGIEVLALPLGYSAALIIHSLLLIVSGRKLLRISMRKLVRPVAQCSIAALVAGVIAYTALNHIASFGKLDTLATVLFQGLFAAFVGFSAYLIMQYIFKNQELLEMIQSLKQRLIRSEIPVPQEEDTRAV